MKHLCFLILFLFSLSAPSYSQNNEQQIDTLNKEVTRLYKAGKYTEAINIAKQVLTLNENKHGANHPSVGNSLNNLAELHRLLGHYAKAEPLYKRSLNINKNTVGPNHASVGTNLNNLGLLYASKGDTRKAELFYKDALQTRKKAHGPDHPDVAGSLNNLAELYRTLGRTIEAEPLYKQALQIYEKSFGPEHPHVGVSLNNLGVMYYGQGRYTEAESLYKRALQIREKSLSKEHYHVGNSLSTLALLYKTKGQFTEAETRYKRALLIYEKTIGPDHPHFGNALNNLAELYRTQGQYAKAEPLYKTALKIYKNAAGPDHPKVGNILNNLAVTHQAQGRTRDVEILFKRASDIFSKVLGKTHPQTGISLNNLAGFYQAQGRYTEAEPLYLKTIQILENAFGPDHPNIGIILNNLAALYEKLNRPEEVAKIRARLAKMPEPGTRHLPLYFMTNRKPHKSGGYSTELSLTYSLGRIVMQIPEAQVKNRAKRIGESLGQLEKARSGKLTMAKALKIVRSRPLKTPEQFAASVRSSQARSAIFKNQALVFVHGYNTNFNEAMKRATQLSFDLQFDGTLMPFTWPSQGKVSGYLTDVEHAGKSIDTLVTFLDQLRDTMPELKINLLAHSLGNKVMLNALCKIAKRNDGKSHNFGQVISAHADVSYDDFEKLTSCFKEKVKGNTLYVNEQDSALRFRCSVILKSKCRAGNYARGYHAADVIDTTKMSGGFFRTLSKGFDHDIFVRNPLLFSDIARLILTGQRPVEKRTIEFRPKKSSKGPAYWAYDKSYNPANPFLKAEAR